MCRKPLSTPTSRFCSECGAEQVPAQSVSTNIGGNVIDSTLISTTGSVSIGKGEAVECPDCFGTGIEHIECPNCEGTGLVNEMIPKEKYSKDDEEKIQKINDSSKHLQESNNAQSKLIGSLLSWGLFAAHIKKDIDHTEYVRNEKNYRDISCPVCNSRKLIPINHELVLKKNKIKNIANCPTCNGFKKIYLPN